MPETIGQRHIRIYDRMKSDRGMLEAYWQDINYYSLPRKAYINKVRNLGDRLPVDIYDSTAIVALSYFAAGMQAYMSSPQTKWFSLGLDNIELVKKSKSVRTWLKDSEDVLYNIINDSNWYQEDVEGYTALGGIGTDVLYAAADVVDTVRFESLEIQTVLVEVNSVGRANQAYREYEFNCEQAVEMFGTKVDQKVTKCLADGDYTSKFKYLMVVRPREIFHPGKKDKLNMPFEALWIERETKATVKEGGFKKFPFLVSRFTKGGTSAYGYSPIMNVFSDIKMINSMEKVNILGAQLSVLPPREIPDDAFMKPYNFNPGGTNIRNPGFDKEHIRAIEGKTNVPLGIEYVQTKQRVIQQALFNDLFLMFESLGGNKTATEVSILNNQRMQMLGSAIGNIMREKLNPMIELVFNIASESGKLPPLPAELFPTKQKPQGENYNIQYISPLARAQQALELQNFQQGLAIIGAMGEVNQGVYDKFDFDEAADYVAELTRMNPKLMKDKAEVEALRAARAEQEAFAAELELMKQGTESAKTAAEADKNRAQAVAV